MNENIKERISDIVKNNDKKHDMIEQLRQELK